MDRKKIIAGLAAFLSGAALSVGSVQAQLTGYLAGDPAPGKLVPYYQVADNLATLIGIENTAGILGPQAIDGFDVLVHVRVYTPKSVEQTDFDLCLSPFDFGFIILQKAVPSAGQLDELFGAPGRFNKARVLSLDNGDVISTEGYVSLRAVSSHDSTDGSCSGTDNFEVDLLEGSGTPLAAWAILQNIGSGFFAVEIPVPTANVDDSSGGINGGFGAFGLIPGPTTGVEGEGNIDGNTVIARFDVNPFVDSETSIYVWLAHNGGADLFDFGPGDAEDPSARASTITAWLDCEDEFEQSTSISLPNEINVINPDLLAGISQCKQQGQYRGVLRFAMPDTGFVWSQVSQAGQNYRENFLGYNLDENFFLQ